jgi:hypothetical protein
MTQNCPSGTSRSTLFSARVPSAQVLSMVLSFTMGCGVWFMFVSPVECLRLFPNA